MAWRKSASCHIDEALANVVESNKVTANNLTTVLMSIPHELRKKRFPGAIKTLEQVEHWLKAKGTAVAGDNSQLLWGEGSERITQELRLLRVALGGVASIPACTKKTHRKS